MIITLDRAVGAAEMRKGAWSQRVPITDLPKWRALYRRLWARGSKTTSDPGPWARFYDDDLRVLDLAIQNAGEEG